MDHSHPRTRVKYFIYITLLLSAGCVKHSSSGDPGTPTPTPTPSCTAGTSWETVDDYLYTSSGGVAQAVGGDTAGNIYIGGKGTDTGGVTHWITRMSLDEGTSWATMDNFQFSAGYDADVSAIGFDSTGALYVSGTGNDTGGISHWIVRKSLDSGSTWATVDDFQYAIGKDNYPWAFGADSGGNIFVAGEGIDSGNALHWIVRKSVNQGASWSTVDDFSAGSAQSFAVDESGNLYAAGYGSTPSNLFVRKSSDGGISWATVDNFQYASGQNSYAFAFGVDPFGSLYSAGQGDDSGGAFHWIVRKSTDAGSSWNLIDDFQYQSGGAAIAIKSDTSGNLFVAGYGPVPNGVSNWFVRESSDHGSSWNSVDKFQYASGQNSNVLAFGADSSGNLYSAGQGNDSSATPHWVVRKSPCQK